MQSLRRIPSLAREEFGADDFADSSSLFYAHSSCLYHLVCPVEARSQTTRRSINLRQCHPACLFRLIFFGGGGFAYIVDIMGELFPVMSFAKLPKKFSGHDYNQCDLLDGGFIWSEDSSIKYMEGSHSVVSMLCSALLFCCILGSPIWAFIIYNDRTREVCRRMWIYAQVRISLYSQLHFTGLALCWSIFLAIRTMTMSFVVIVFSPINVTTDIRLSPLFVMVL